MKAFYGSRFSPHMTKTPEGFLICHSVPICRTGEQEYLPREIGVEEEKRPIITVLRTPEEVFKPAAIASFEGKPVTDDHPPVPLDSSNYSTYTKGAVQNVHRGTGEDDDKLVCDIVLYDSVLISKVEAGKREISCGYDCKYIPNGDGTYHQADIIGNHAAVGKAVRCRLPRCGELPEHGPSADDGTGPAGAEFPYAYTPDPAERGPGPDVPQ
ncbi:MAG: DUF2213 domain-containing protein [Succiniclasticum sp.]|nr:DUF2213 domain-containing protein [Succiniclasticum sp.]